MWKDRDVGAKAHLDVGTNSERDICSLCHKIDILGRFLNQHDSGLLIWYELFVDTSSVGRWWDTLEVEPQVIHFWQKLTDVPAVSSLVQMFQIFMMIEHFVVSPGFPEVLEKEHKLLQIKEEEPEHLQMKEEELKIFQIKEEEPEPVPIKEEEPEQEIKGDEEEEQFEDKPKNGAYFLSPLQPKSDVTLAVVNREATHTPALITLPQAFTSNWKVFANARFGLLR